MESTMYTIKTRPDGTVWVYRTGRRCAVITSMGVETSETVPVGEIVTAVKAWAAWQAEHGTAATVRSINEQW
jgi:hypothetical protein